MLVPGSRLGPYEITAKLGEGGMGVVFKAKDFHLGREVALKVLPEGFTQDPERLARFEREAKLLASLNHPNIAQIHGLEVQGDVRALVMELVAGPTLAERLEKGSLPLDESLSIARQIAEALEEAHEKGIIHRDLKPQNVKASIEGKVKVLDFGLAKAMDPSGSSAALPADFAHSPTVTFGGTREGVILGTAAYMAPEQARGGEVDKRADIWAFGVVLYEMLTGERLFAEGSVVDTLSAVMRKEIDLGKLPPEVSPRLRELVARCLERDPKRRLRDIGEARWMLTEGLAAGPAADPAPASTPTPAAAVSTWAGVSARLWAAIAVAALAVAVVVAWRSVSAPAISAPAARALRATIPLPEGLELDGVGAPEIALSPDGSTLAFLARAEGEHQKLYLRRLDSDEVKLVPGSETAEGPFFSPDGRWVAFAVGVSSLGGGIPAELRKHSLDTGLTQTICPIEDYFGGVWREDGTIVFNQLFAQPFWSVPASGGSKRPLGEQLREGGVPRNLPLLWPASLPDDRWLLAVTSGHGTRELVVVDLDSAEVTRLGIIGSSPRYLPTGHLAFAGLDGSLQAVPFDATARRPTGPPVAMVSGVAFARFFSATYAVADDGTLVYATGYLRNSRHEPMRVVRASRAGQLEVLPVEADLYGRAFAVAPDGRRLALAREDTGSWIVDLRRGTRAKIGGAQLSGQSDVVWSPDGDRLAWAAAAGGDEADFATIYTQSSDGRSDPQPLRAVGGDPYLGGWTPDGRALVISRPGDDAVSFLLELQPLDGTRELLWRELGTAPASSLSPDGRLLAFETDAGEGYQIALYSLASGERIGVTSAGGRRPSWSGDGRELYFRRGDSVQAVEVEIDERGTPHVGRETKLFDWPAAYLWTAGPDGFFYGTEPVPRSVEPEEPPAPYRMARRGGAAGGTGRQAVSATMPIGPGTRLGPYEITAKLGEGGMGVVFQAKDFQLGREVALKVLPEGFTQDPERLARFEREAKLLASLNHPNIAHVYGLETAADGSRALVMELVEGPTLAERLEKGALPLDESLSIARQIAEALEEAHEKGIIHRDLKPQNVKASIEGKVKVLDFGLAKALDPVGSSAALPADLAHSPTVTFGGTLEGVILGTAAYMAPEQARGAAVDKRADIWAFGVVLYEMLAGERLFAEASVVDTLSAVMRKEIDLEKLPASTPPRLRELVSRCLERDPRRRLRDIGEARLLLAGELDRGSASMPAQSAAIPTEVAPPKGRAHLVVAAAVVVALAATVVWLVARGREGSEPARPAAATSAATERSIAVLPFQNLSAEAENAFFAAGVHEDVLTYLSRVADLKVISRSSVMQYAEPEQNLKQIAAELGVAYVVEGSVRRAADRVRVTAQLIDARTDEHLWAESYDRDLADVFAIQTAIAQEIVGALQASLSPREAELLASRPTSNLEAYDLFLQARQRIQQQGLADVAGESIHLLERALRLDPQFAQAHALLATEHGRLYWFLADRTPERLARMKSAVDRAFELRPDLPEARVALAEYYYRGFYDYPRALEQLELARKSLPNDSILEYFLGLTYRRVGEHDRSIDSFEQATRLDPANLAAWAEAVGTAQAAGRAARGAALAAQAEKRFPRNAQIAGQRAQLALFQFGDVAGARAILDAAEAEPDYKYYEGQYETSFFERNFRRAAELAREPALGDSAALGYSPTLAAEALALGGFEAEAKRLLREAEGILVAEVAKPYADNYGWPHLAYAYNLALQGRADEALASCERAMRILPYEKDKVHGARFRQECAWVKAKAGKTDEALGDIEASLAHPYSFSRWQLALEPRWDFLRGNARFRELATPPRKQPAP